jgi:hypothetical protein
MTPQNKAKHIIERFESGLTIKDCAMICVSEMIDLLDGLELSQEVIEQFAYLQEVKQEIKNHES